MSIKEIITNYRQNRLYHILGKGTLIFLLILLVFIGGALIYDNVAGNKFFIFLPLFVTVLSVFWYWVIATILFILSIIFTSVNVLNLSKSSYWADFGVCLYFFASIILIGCNLLGEFAKISVGMLFR